MSWWARQNTLIRSGVLNILGICYRTTVFVLGVGDRLYERWEFESERKAFEVQVKGSLIMNDSLLAMGAALDDLRLIYSTEDAIINKVEAGDLEIVLGQYAPTSTGWYLYFPQRSQVHPKLRAFIEHVNSLRSASGRQDHLLGP